ncbi:hypothetical protein VT03_00335 [Planctomyces sp. SH-PL14]|nr:hypothetical protein VT03_00335 [Planctomyces sp. SH-PL14]
MPATSDGGPPGPFSAPMIDLRSDRVSSSDVPPASSPAYPLEEDFWETGTARFKRWIPWLHLFQAFRIAMDYRKLLVAAVGILLLAAGEWACSLMPFAPSTFRYVWPWESAYDSPLNGLAVSANASSIGAPLSDSTVFGVRVLRPLRDFVSAGWPLVRPSRTWGEIALGWTRLLWLLAVTGLCGGMIARLAALNFAGKDCSLRSAFRYCFVRLASYMGGPLLPVVGLGLLWGLCAVGGLVGVIPVAGPWLVAIFWFLPLILGIMMSVVLLGVGCGWPLMYATVSAEGSDAFDGLSRSYSYLFSRPWYALWLLVVTCVYGTALVLFLHTVIDLGVRCAFWSVQSGMGEDRLRALVPSEFAGAPTDFVGATGPERVTEVWMNAVRMAEPAFLFSYFWTAAAIVYFLLRRSVDATPLDAVDEDFPLSTEPFPLVGMPAVEKREAANDSGPEPTSPPAPAT